LEKGKAYAAENGLQIDVIPDALKVLKIRGTPTLLLVDDVEIKGLSPHFRR